MSYLEKLKQETDKLKNGEITYDEYGDNILGSKNVYGSENIRKFYYIFSKVLDNLEDEKYDNSDDDIKRLENIRDEIRKERMKLQTVNIERNRLDRQEARHELWYEQVSEYVKKIEPPKYVNFGFVENNDMKYILTIADVHAGTQFKSNNNEYNFDVIRKRFEILLNKTIKFISDKRLNELNIVLLADLIEGTLRISDLQSQDTKVVKACVDISNIIVDFLNKLSSYCKLYVYDVCYGNHSQTRYLGTKANQDMTEDLGYFIGNYIKKALELNDRIEITLPEEDDIYIEINNIFDYNIIAFHGHQVKNFNSCLKDLSMQRRKIYDYAIVGHLHSDKTITSYETENYDCEVLQSSSFMGSSPYSDSIFKGSKGACEIYGFDKKYGRIENYKIILK